MLLLSVSPHSCHGLVVVGWVPIGVKHDQTIGSDEVEATPTRLAAEHEHKVTALRGKGHVEGGVSDTW